MSAQIALLPCGMLKIKKKDRMLHESNIDPSEWDSTGGHRNTEEKEKWSVLVETQVIQQAMQFPTS
jgi:hypothetical protein